MPPGLTLQSPYGPRDAGDELAGTPTQAGTFSFLIQVTDTQGNSVNGTVTITINP